MHIMQEKELKYISDNSLDIFYIARINGFGVDVLLDQLRKSYRIELCKNGWHTVKYISWEGMEKSGNDIEFIKNAIKHMIDSMKGVIKNEEE